MSYNREMLRKEAMAIYKREIKKIKKAQRISFADFFKKYVEMKEKQIVPVETPNPQPAIPQEDFDLESVLVVNNDA